MLKFSYLPAAQDDSDPMIVATSNVNPNLQKLLIKEAVWDVLDITRIVQTLNSLELSEALTDSQLLSVYHGLLVPL